MTRSGGIVAALAACAAAVAQETWTLEKPYVWARDGQAITLSQDGAGFTVAHAGARDWSLGGIPRISVKPGEIFELACKVKLTTDEEWANAETGVVLRDAAGRELSWSYGGAACAAPCEWTALKTRFMVPKNGASIEPRLIGHGAATIRAEGFALRRAGSAGALVSAARPARVRYARGALSLDGDLEAGVLVVADGRTGRAWRLDLAASGWLVLDGEALKQAPPAGATLTLLHPETMREYRVTLELADAAELCVTVAGDGALDKPLDFPPPFETRAGERLIVPMNEGMGFPVEEEHEGLWRLIAYGGHGLCMGFFGAVEDATGAGWMCVLETPDDAAMNARRGADGLWRAGPSWDAQRGRFGYARRARYVFFDQGGHVAMCKRYRAHAKRAGLFKPFAEKVKRNPNIDLLIGAANIWNWDAKEKKAELVAEMQAAGIDRILWSGGGSAAELNALNARPRVLTGRYDIYQDIMDPARFEQVGYKHGDWVTEAFPHDINWAGPSAAHWRRGWRVKAKDGTMIPCAVICDAQALPYARKRISEELATKPYRARFIDTTVAAPWFECYHPDHPMTRTQSREHKMALLKLIGDLGLVCGSETGHEASVPFCDYFEGMLSVGPYRVPDAGRDMARVWDEVPERVAKYQVGERYRLPLWELVYHDCVVAQWYWGDYNNKLPAVWRKRDLFNALYGTPPMYMFNLKQWAALKARFVASYQVAAPVARATGYAEMTDHRFLSPDRRVQRSAFANGVQVTVNFGDAPYTDADGAVIAPLDLRVTGL